ncbi:MAG: glucose PTS transporter subunit EIIB [Ruminococcus sp.]|nr:glucose PTS transporter subunit EIIB [Ruminococcus sp.]
MGVFYAFIYYFVFYFMITRFNFKTPGRKADSEEAKLYTQKDLDARNKSANGQAALTGADRVSALILKCLGGKSNLLDIDCCATRLRITVEAPERVNDSLLKESGASGMIHKGNGVQIIYGPQVSVVKSNFEGFLDKPESDSADALIGNAPEPADRVNASKENKGKSDKS